MPLSSQKLSISSDMDFHEGSSGQIIPETHSRQSGLLALCCCDYLLPQSFRLSANRTDSGRNTPGYRIPGLARPPMPNFSLVETENQTGLIQVLQRHGLGGQTQSQLYPLAICNFLSYLNMNLNFHIYKIKSRTFTKDTAWHFVIKSSGFAVTA